MCVLASKFVGWITLWKSSGLLSASFKSLSIIQPCNSLSKLSSPLKKIKRNRLTDSFFCTVRNQHNIVKQLNTNKINLKESSLNVFLLEPPDVLN